MIAYRKHSLHQLLNAWRPKDSKSSGHKQRVGRFVRFADELNNACQAKAVVPMQVTDEQSLNGSRINVGPCDLSSGAFTAVYQIGRLAKAQRNA